jgi:hypothetical protein
MSHFSSKNVFKQVLPRYTLSAPKDFTHKIVPVAHANSYSLLFNKIMERPYINKHTEIKSNIFF